MGKSFFLTSKRFAPNKKTEALRQALPLVIHYSPINHLKRNKQILFDKNDIRYTIMKTVVLVLAALFAVSLAQIITIDDDYDMNDLWFKFKEKFHKNYESDKEEDKRFGTFKINVDLIKQLNQVQKGFHLEESKKKKF